MRVLLITALLSASAFAQSWSKVAADTTKTSVALPKGTIYRISSGNCYQTASVSAPTTIASPFPTVCPGTPQVDVLQTTVMQSISVTTSKGTVNVTVSAVPSIAVIATYTCTVQYKADGTFTSTSCVAVK